jgi:hypothetical protein
MSASLALGCTNLPVASLQPTFYFANKEDITFTVASGVITDFTMSGGTNIYKWEGPSGSTFLKGTYEQRQGTLLNGFGHSVTAVLLQDTQVALNELANINNGKFVVFMFKETSTGTPTIRVYGATHGLVATEITGDETGTDNEGLPGFVLSTPEGVKESLAPQHYLDTDYATSLAAIVAALPA